MIIFGGSGERNGWKDFGDPWVGFSAAATTSVCIFDAGAAGDEDRSRRGDCDCKGVAGGDLFLFSIDAAGDEDRSRRGADNCICVAGCDLFLLIGSFKPGGGSSTTCWSEDDDADDEDGGDIWFCRGGA